MNSHEFNCILTIGALRIPEIVAGYSAVLPRVIPFLTDWSESMERLTYPPTKSTAPIQVIFPRDRCEGTPRPSMFA